jgi:hypothetical protein
VKVFTAILFSLLLALTPFAPLQAASTCPPAKRMACCTASCHMACCAHQNGDSNSVPAVPSQKNGAPNQVSLLALAVVLWTLPEQPDSLISSADASPQTTTGMPLYARHCALLL